MNSSRAMIWGSAMKRANAIARKAGYASARVLRVEEQSGDFGGYPMPVMAVREQSSAKDTPIAPGQVRIGSTMNFTFEMVK